MNDYFGKSSFQNGNWAGKNGQNGQKNGASLGCAECKAKKEVALKARANGSRDPEAWSDDLSCSKCKKKKAPTQVTTLEGGRPNYLAQEVLPPLPMAPVVKKSPWPTILTVAGIIGIGIIATR